MICDSPSPQLSFDSFLHFHSVRTSSLAFYTFRKRKNILQSPLKKKYPHFFKFNLIATNYLYAEIFHKTVPQLIKGLIEGLASEMEEVSQH